jgi:hypothetical protein
MNLSTLTTSLTVLGAIKKQLILTQATIRTWFEILKPVSDEDGLKAFNELMSTTIYGDAEPAHILEIVQKNKEMWANRDDSQYPWISKAPKYEGEKFLDLDRGIPTAAYSLWKNANEHKRYRSTNQQDEIFLIQNPECWDWAIKGDKICFIRPEPEATGEKRSDGVKQKQRPSWKSF